MKVWKKLSAVALALVMVMALCVPAFAAAPTFGDMDSGNTATNEDGVLGEFTQKGTVVNTYSGKYVLLYKQIQAYNKDEGTINAPTITYKYAIAAGTGSTSDAPVTITDKFDVALGVTAGKDPANVKITGTVSKTTGDTPTWDFSTSTENNKQLAFTPAVQLTAAEGGSKNVFPIKVDFSDVTFDAAGVYRYVITETVNDAQDDETSITAKNAAGIADGSINNVRYLDVYVKDGSTAGSYDIYGFVCFQDLSSEKSINGTESNGTATDDNNLTAIAKTEGFVADNNGTTDATADAYYTFNVTVSKTLVNDQAMNDHPFPFFVNMKNSSVTADIKLKTLTTTNATAGTVTDEENTANLSTSETGIARSPKIDHQSNIKYIGIPVGVTAATVVTVYETNDVTGTTYTSDIMVGTTAGTSKVISWITTGDANKSETAMLIVEANKADTTAHEIAFTNTLLNISPTGVTLRYAPYLAMMGAGIVALPLSLRKKEELD